MLVKAQKAFEDIQNKHFKPVILVLGEESFQIDEIKNRFKNFFQESDSTFAYEKFDTEQLDIEALLNSLNETPLVSLGKLVVCHSFEKIKNKDLELLSKYFEKPNPNVCLLLISAKADKKKSWFEKIDHQGYVIEVSEPFDRDWDRWKIYFEIKLKNKIEKDLWLQIVEKSQKKLSVVWQELQKLSAFIGPESILSMKHLNLLNNSTSEKAIFDLASELIAQNTYSYFLTYHQLKLIGENDVKLFTIIVRQLELIYFILNSKDTEANKLSSKLGLPLFVMRKLMSISQKYTQDRMRNILIQAAFVDSQLKVGKGNLDTLFLWPFNSRF